MRRCLGFLPDPRVAALLVALVGLLTVMPTPTLASEAVVVTEAAPVFEAPHTTSGLVAVLSRGAHVSLRFSLGTTPAWCRVEASQGAVTGYTQCEHIRLQAEARPSGRSLPQPPETRRPSPRSAEPSPDVAMKIIMNKYNAAFWARWLGFSDDQMSLLRKEAQRTGVSECRARIVAWRQRHGLDDPSQPDPAENFKQAMRDLPSIARGVRCDVAQFWREFPRIMTPEQRRAFDSWQRQPDVPILTRAPLDPSLEWFD